MSRRFDSSALCSRYSSRTAHRAPLRRRTESGALRGPCRVTKIESVEIVFFQFAAVDADFSISRLCLCLHVHCRASGLSQFQSPPYWLAVFFRSRVGAAIATRPVFVLAPASFGSDDWRAALCHC